MTADERLDQLEPLLSEALTVLDRHTYQLKQLNSAVGQLNSAVSHLANVATHQGDNISFLLREQLAMKTQQDQMDGKLDQILQLLQKPGQ
jgi:ABC-type transporter Mla subunit MlaD